MQDGILELIPSGLKYAELIAENSIRRSYHDLSKPNDTQIGCGYALLAIKYGLVLVDYQIEFRRTHKFRKSIKMADFRHTVKTEFNSEERSEEFYEDYQDQYSQSVFQRPMTSTPCPHSMYQPQFQMFHTRFTTPALFRNETQRHISTQSFINTQLVNSLFDILPSSVTRKCHPQIP